MYAAVRLLLCMWKRVTVFCNFSLKYFQTYRIKYTRYKKIISLSNWVSESRKLEKVSRVFPRKRGEKITADLEIRKMVSTIRANTSQQKIGRNQVSERVIVPGLNYMFAVFRITRKCHSHHLIVANDAITCLSYPSLILLCFGEDCLDNKWNIR